MTSIYVLGLIDGRYYVGRSDNVQQRYQQHLNGDGSAWTKKYRPVSLVETIKGGIFDEDKVTKQYMAKYGIDNVRGGSYVQIQLSEVQKEALKLELWGAQDRCSQCGRTGHFVKDCYANTDVCGNQILRMQLAPGPLATKAPLQQLVTKAPRKQLVTKAQSTYECSTCDRTFTTAFGCRVHERSCEPEWGCDYCDKTFTTENGCRVHERSCKPTGACYRCGRAGHYSPDCYASTHKKGYSL